MTNARVKLCRLLSRQPKFVVHGCQEAPAQDLKELKQLAASAVAEFLRSPDVFQFDLLHAPVIQQLEGDADEGQLYELLQISIRGDMKVVNRTTLI